MGNLVQACKKDLANGLSNKEDCNIIISIAD